MPRIAPQADVHDAALVGRIFFELQELKVADGFKGKTEQPDAESNTIKQSKRRAAAAYGQGNGQGNDKQQEPLQQKDLQKAPDQISAAPFFTPGSVAVVFRLTSVADTDVQHETGAPGNYQQKNQYCPGFVYSRCKVGSKRGTDKTAAPGNIGNIIAVFGNRYKEPGYGIEKNHQGLNKEYLQHSFFT